MRIIHLNQSDIVGGAARAAYRIHHCLRETGVDSRMWVDQSRAGDWTVEGPRNKLEKAMGLLRPQVVKPLVNTLKTANPVLHSPAILPSSWVKRINASDADVVHLHWVQGEMLSIAEIGRIQKPIVWTLHDMWAFCGAEHYTTDTRWQDGYHRHNRPAHESGFDLNRWTWHRKQRHWQRPLHIVAPSRWLADCARNSKLMRDWPVIEIPYPIDLDVWSPIDRDLARTLLKLPLDKPLILFGAVSGTRDPRKGFDLLLTAFDHLFQVSHIQNIELVIFGQCEPKLPLDLKFPIHYMGHLYDDLSLRILYSAADVMMVPSRQDNLPLTAMEAHSCGVPVVCFDNSGLSSIVDHKSTGYLAQAFDSRDLAQGILWALDPSHKIRLRQESRKLAVTRFSNASISQKYKDIYKSLVN